MSIETLESESNGQTDVVRQGEGWSAPSVWRHHKDAVGPKLRVDMDSLKYLQKPGMSTGAKWRTRGSVRSEEKSCYSSSEEDPTEDWLTFQAFRKGSQFLFFFLFGWGPETPRVQHHVHRLSWPVWSLVFPHVGFLWWVVNIFWGFPSLSLWWYQIFVAHLWFVVVVGLLDCCQSETSSAL